MFVVNITYNRVKQQKRCFNPPSNQITSRGHEEANYYSCNRRKKQAAVLMQSLAGVYNL